MLNNTVIIKKVPPFMNELVETYNICYGGLNKIERCVFGRKVVRRINMKDTKMYQLCIIHYQLCNREKIYKISYIQDNLDLCNGFFDKDSKMYFSSDGSLGCLFSNNDKKLRIDLFKNESINGKFFFTCMNNVSINDIHRNFFFHESFCSFNSNNTLLIYSAENDDIRLKKENNLPSKEIEMLKKLNNGVYIESFGEKFNCSFFYLYVYNLLDNSVKYITVKDVSSCYYSPQFIDETSFVCLSYRTVPFRLGIYAFNTRPNDLYLCTLNDSDIDNCEDKKTKNKKNYIRCAYVKLSGKHFKHTASPIVIKHNEEVYVACLVVFMKGEECKQHIMEYNLVLIKLAKEEIKQKKKKKVQDEKNEHYYNNSFSSIGSSEENYYDNNTNDEERDMNKRMKSDNFCDHNDDICNYKKLETEVIIKEGNYTSYFRGLYTNEIKGYCYPYIFLNTIFYSSKIIIAVHMFTKKIYKVLIYNIYDKNDINTSIEILCMKNDNIFVSIRNMLLNDVLAYCIFNEANIKGDYIYLTNLKSYNLDFLTYDTIKKEKSILYSNVNDNSKKLFMILSEMETSIFKEKHPYIRRKNPSFNLLYEDEQHFKYDVQQKGLHLPNFNLFNEKKLRNLILYIHGGPYSTLINEYKNVFIFYAACGFDILCINYIGSLSFSDKPNVLCGNINSIEINDIIENFKDFVNYFGDYENVYLYGASYGGYAVCSILTKYNLFKSSCVINGIYEWILSTYSTDVPDYFFNLPLNKNCEYDGNYDKQDYSRIYELSPINFVENISCPVLIICGKDDLRVSYHNSISLYNRLRGLKKKCKLFLFENCNHSIENYLHEETMLMNVILWFYDYEIKKKK
ncbi:peptidase, putative [Plasmodium gallinaceum]|uniref:Peptidase, putative n=1 Tax=Plasmodium gallinaceum TaxID=5849 RepID=A0A1J1GPL2_PLAGA|nr:peptidase, putative [Plasmodium gallinaceum]CRG94244.1 peptidase, putative [Plasmodium gallinaceum]